MNREDHIEILARSSSDAPHTVTLYPKENGISVLCSCPAGVHRRLCKHVLGVLAGDDTVLHESNQRETLLRVSCHVRRTRITLLLSRLHETEVLLENAQRDVRSARTALEEAVLR